MYNNLPIFLISFCLQRKCKRRVHGLQGGSLWRLRTLENHFHRQTTPVASTINLIILIIFIVRVFGGFVSDQINEILFNFHRQAAKHAMPRPHSHAPTMLSPWWVLEQMPPQVIVGDGDDVQLQLS